MTTDEDVSVYVLDPGGLDMKWFYVARYFDDEVDAKTAFDEMQSERNTGLAGYRLLDGDPKKGGKPKVVLAIGTNSERVRIAARGLGGIPYWLHEVSVRGLAMRRLRFLVAGEALGIPAGVHSFDHGPRGMALNREGQPVPLEEA